MNAKIFTWIVILFICLAMVVSGCSIKVDASENDEKKDNSIPEPETIVLLVAGLIAGGALLLSRPGRKKRKSY